MEKIKKKLKIVLFIMFLISSFLMFRIFSINFNDELAVRADAMQHLKINIFKKRADFLDCNFNKLTNEKNIYKALVFPNKINLNEVVALNCKISQPLLLKKFQQNKPFLVEIEKEPEKNQEGIYFFKIEKRYDEGKTNPVHILGYLNKDEEGVAGLEYHLNDFLKKDCEKLDVLIPLNGKRNILEHENFKMIKTKDNKKAVVLTIDKNIQYILNKIGENYIKKGAGVVLNAKTGEILAISSFPLFNPNEIKNYLKDENKSLLNRALLNYNVGSIFKIVTAAAALKKNISPKYSYYCDGSFKLNDVTFKCHNLKGHQQQDMTQALKNSCNPYFINLGIKVNGQNMLNMAHNMGFSRNISLTDDLICPKAILPNKDIKKGELCNLSFGQGKLKASILHIAQMLTTISNEGKGVVPSLIKGYIKNNKFINQLNPTYFEAFDKKIALTLKEMLFKTIKETVAESFLTESGGKSSTAQTGNFDKTKKREMLTTWFCSISPIKETKYITVLLKEDGKLGTKDLGPAIKLINSYLSLI